jgi:hypothetical protein
MTDLKTRALAAIAAWNAHDLARFVSLHAGDLTYSSPYAQRMAPESGGVLRGMTTIRPLWEAALAKHPNIHSDVIAVMEGVASVAVHYRTTAKDGPVVDVMHFNDAGLIERLDVYYG